MLVSSVLVNIQPNPVTPEEVVESLASIDGELDLYTWYEGPFLISKFGAKFLQERVFEPLFNRKRDVKLWLYSLEAWNFQNNVDAMNQTTPKGDLINRINKLFVECIYASAFFAFCTQYNEESALSQYVSEALPRKQWLKDLSAGKDPINKTVEELFNQQSTLVDCMKGEDVNKAYSRLQYMEGYYLIREAFLRGLEARKEKVQVAFVLPNNEADYYRDLPNDLEKMLLAEFGEKARGVDLKVYFRFYTYRTLSERPYLGKVENTRSNVRDSDVCRYFNYIQKVKS